MSHSLPANSPPGFDPLFDLPKGVRVFSGYKGRTYLGPAIAKDSSDRNDAVSFGGGASATSDASSASSTRNYGVIGRQSNSGKTSGDLQIPFDPNAPLTPRLLGRDPSPRSPNSRAVATGPRGESLRDSKDGNDDLESNENALPQALYLGLHGELYDASYEPLPRSLRIRGDLDSNPAKYFEQQKNTRTFEVSPFPQPELDHESFFEWEQEVLVWKDRTEKQLRDVRQPTATGRTLYRPKFGAPSLARKASSELLMSTPPESLQSPPSSSPDPTSPDGNREKLDVSNAHGAANKYGSSGSPVRTLPHTNGGNGRARDDEEMESEIPSWDSVLVPAEPNPVDYATYEDYKTAMLRWSALVAQTSPKIVPSPRQLPTLLQLSNHTLINPNPLLPQEAAALSYSFYPQGDDDRISDDGDELADDADDDALFDGPNDRFRPSDSIGSSETRDDADDTGSRKLRRKQTHDSAPGSSPGSPSLGFDRRKSLKISRLPLTLISQNSWWDSDANPALSSPQDSPSDVYASPSNSPHSLLHRSNGRTPRSRMARTKFASQNAAPLPSRPGLATMSHPSSSMDSARIATPPGTLDALPPMIPKSARGRESSADNSPFAPRSSSGPTLTLAGVSASGSPTVDSALAGTSGTSPSAQTQLSGATVPASMSRGSLMLGSNSRPSSMKVLPVVAPETRDSMEKLFSGLIDRQNARYLKFGRFGCDPVRGDGVLGAPNTSPLPEINYKLLVSQSVASKKNLADAHRTQLWQAHPSRKGDLDVPYLHLSPLGPRGGVSSQTSPVQLPVLQAWANTLASRPRESHRTTPHNSPIYQALLEVLGTSGAAETLSAFTSSSTTAIQMLSLLDVPSFVSLLATEFVPVAPASNASKDIDADSPTKKSPRKVALVHTFATWLFPTARKSKAREMSTSPRGSGGGTATLVATGSAGKKDGKDAMERGMRESPSREALAKERADRAAEKANIESAPHSTDTLTATPSRNSPGHNSRTHAQTLRVRHFQQLLRLSQEIQNPKVLFKLSFLLYLCISHRPKQASEIFSILFEHLASMVPRPEDEAFGSSSVPHDGVSLSDDEGMLPPPNRARSNSTSSATASELTSSTATGLGGSLNFGASPVAPAGTNDAQRARDFHTYASRQSSSDSLESALYSTLFLLNYGRSCPVEYHTWHKSLLPEFPDFKSASMLPNAYQLFSARGVPPPPSSSLANTNSTPSTSSSVTSERSFFTDGSSSLPSSSAGNSATNPTSAVAALHPSPQPEPGSHLGSSGTASEHSSTSTKYSASSSSSAGEHSHPSTHSTPGTSWEIKDTATRLALCVDRAHQLQLIAKFVSEALGPVYGTSTSSSSSSAAFSPSPSTSTPPSKSLSSSSATIGSAAALKNLSSLPFPFQVGESPIIFTRRLFESWRMEVALVVHIMTKNLRDEIGSETSSDDSSDDSDPVNKAAKTMPNLPSESARLIRFMMGRTGLGSRSRLASTLSHFTVSWILQFDRHVNFWNSVCQYESSSINEEKPIPSSVPSQSPAKSPALKITIALNQDSLDYADAGEDERLASSTTSSTFSGGLMPSSSIHYSMPSIRLSIATSAAAIRMVLQRPNAKFVEWTNHALKSKLVHVRQFASNLVNLCIHHDSFTSVTTSTPASMPQQPVPSGLSLSTSVSASLDKSSSARGTAMSASSSHGQTTANSGGGASQSSSLASLAVRFPPQPWIQLWLSRLGGLAVLDGLTHGLSTRSTIHGYGFTERGNVPTFSSSTSSNNLVVQPPTSPRGERGGMGPSPSAGSIGSNTPTHPNSPGPGSNTTSHSAAGERSSTPTGTGTVDHRSSRVRRTSISVSGVSALRSTTSTNNSVVSPAPLQATSLQSSPMKLKPSSSSSNTSTPQKTLMAPESATVSRSASGRELMKNLGSARQETHARQQQRQRLLLSNYQSIPSASAQAWHALFWKTLGPPVSLFDATTHPLQFIAGKTQLSTAPTWMYPHVPQDLSHSLLDHLSYDPIFVNHGSHSPSSTSSSSASSYFPSFGSGSSGSGSNHQLSFERPTGVAFVLGASSNPNHVRWSWDGAQGVPSVIPPPLTPQLRSELMLSATPSSVPIDVLALMNPFAVLDSALLADMPLMALRDGKLFHRTLGRLFKSDSGPHASMVASTLVMIASSLRRQSLLVPKSGRSPYLIDDMAIPSSSHSSSSAGASSDLPEIELSLDHLIRLLVFVTTPVPTYMHSASAAAQSAFYRENTPASARDGNHSSTATTPSTSISTPLNIPIGGERASFFKTRAASIRLLQLIVTSASMLNWLTGPLLLPLVNGSNASPQGSSGMATISSLASSAAASGTNTPTSSKPPTPQASAGAAVSPLSMTDLGYQNPSPSRRGKKDSGSNLNKDSKDKDKDKDKDSATAAGRRGRKGGLNISGIISTGSTEALSPRSMGTDGSPESATTSGGGPGGMIVGRGVPPSSGASNTPVSADGSPSNTTSGSKDATGATVEPLHLRAPLQLYASHPLSSTPSSLENALTPLLSANTSPPVSPRVPSNSGSATPPSSFVSSSPTPFLSNTPLGSSSDSIPGVSGRSSLMGSSNTIPNGPAFSDASAAVWITMIEGLISVVRFGTDISSAMAAAEALRNFIFSRPTVMDVFTKPLSAQVAIAFAPLLKEKKDRKGSTVLGSIEELILQARQSGASRGHHSSSLGSASQFGTSQPSNATTVSNYTTPSSWLVCNSTFSNSPSNGSVSASSSAYGEKSNGWAVPTIEASLQVLLRLHASLSVGQSPTISTSLFSHLVDGLNTTQPLPHIANSLFALTQLLCGPVAPMPPTGSSSSSSAFPPSFSGSGSGQGSSPQAASLLGSAPTGSLLNATLAERHANHAQAIRLQKQLVAQFANPVVFGKIRAIFMRLLDDDFIFSLVDPTPQLNAQTPSIYILPHPASIAAHTAANQSSAAHHNEESSDSTVAASKHHHSSISVLKSPASIFGGIFGKKSKDSAANATSSSPSLLRASAHAPSPHVLLGNRAATHPVQTPIQPALRPPIKSNVVLASQAAPGAYLAFVQLASLCHIMSLNHKIMKAAKTSPEFVDVIRTLSRFVPGKSPLDNSK